MRVRVTRKLAECVDGVDLSLYSEGDVIDLAEREAQLIVAEKWAVPARRASDFPPSPADRGDSDLYQRLRDKREHIDQQRRSPQRRATDHGPSDAAR